MLVIRCAGNRASSGTRRLLSVKAISAAAITAENGKGVRDRGGKVVLLPQHQHHATSTATTAARGVVRRTLTTTATLAAAANKGWLSTAKTSTIRLSRSRKSCFGAAATDSVRWSSSAAEEGERERMDYDVVIVGAGPAGLAAAIRLKQLTKESEGGRELSVCVLEKGAEVGAHILSGNVFEPRALDELISDWRDREDIPVNTPVTHDLFTVLTSGGSFSVPNIFLPKSLHNHGNYVISLSMLCRWLATHAEELGVEIYPGFAVAEVLYSEGGGVVGVATRDVGIAKDGSRKATFERGVQLRGKQTLFAEGARGSCSEEIMKKLGLRKDCDVQSFGLGVKEVWQVPDEGAKPGWVQHTVGWPVQSGPFDKTYAGSFLYHMKSPEGANLVHLGMVVGLDYENPYLNPYKEFQRWKHHPAIKQHLEGGECIQYGARVLNEGGYHALPKVSFKGGALLGCAAGTLNAVKIKGSHNAMKSGMLAAEAVHELLANESEGEAEGLTDEPKESDYDKRLKESWVMQELKEVRNTHGAFAAGVLPGVVYTGLSAFFMKGREPWSFHNKVPDSTKTKKASDCTPIEYPKPDGKLSFDLLSNLTRSGTNHEHDQPSHLRIKPELKDVPSEVSYPVYAGPEQRFCPAQVYEYTQVQDKPKLVINAQNCVHCKCCAIKMPEDYINWTVPEGGGGPKYTVM